jgi:hypothetical protein
MVQHALHIAVMNGIMCGRAVPVSLFNIPLLKNGNCLNGNRFFHHTVQANIKKRSLPHEILSAREM